MAVSRFPLRTVRSNFHLFSDYFAALLRTNQAFVAPTQGKLLNYVHRVPLGVVAQITVSFMHLQTLKVSLITPL